MTDYQIAKARFGDFTIRNAPPRQFDPSGQHADRKASNPFTYSRSLAAILWASNIKELFPEARIIRNSVDRKNNARCYFKLEVQA